MSPRRREIKRLRLLAKQLRRSVWKCIEDTDSIDWTKGVKFSTGFSFIDSIKPKPDKGD